MTKKQTSKELDIKEAFRLIRMYDGLPCNVPSKIYDFANENNTFKRKMSRLRMLKAINSIHNRMSLAHARRGQKAQKLANRSLFDLGTA